MTTVKLAVKKCCIKKRKSLKSLVVRIFFIYEGKGRKMNMTELVNLPEAPFFRHRAVTRKNFVQYFNDIVL